MKTLNPNVFKILGKIGLLLGVPRKSAEQTARQF